jgi:hypothetical protein
MKDILSTEPFCLPRLQEIVLPEDTTNRMAPHAAPKQKSKQKHTLDIAISLV